MHAARTFDPNLVGGDLHAIWIYLTGPLLGATVAVAVGMAYRLRGPGGARRGSQAAQRQLDPDIKAPAKASCVLASGNPHAARLPALRGPSS